MKVLIVGSDVSGSSCVAIHRRLGETAGIAMVEKGPLDEEIARLINRRQRTTGTA